MYKYLLSFLLLLIFTTAFSQVVVPPPPTGGAGNTGTPGAQATPIDEYTIYLIGIAVLIAVAYFTVKKFKKSLI